METCFAPTISTFALLPKIEDTQNALLHSSNSLSFLQEILLSDGRKAIMRSVRPDDKPALLAFYNRLSSETRFLRYHYSKGQLTEQDLKDICDIDHKSTVVLVVEIEQGINKEIIGIGHFIRLPFDHTAEVAFTVQDNEQNKGIGTQLLKYLSKMAWQQDIYFFFGEVLRQNGKMLSVFQKADPKMKQEIDSPITCTVTLSVVEAMHRIP
jgi:hypothetical protein